MIVQVIGGLLVATALALLLRAFWIRAGMTPARAALGLGIIAILVLLIALVASGRIHWLLVAVAAAVPFGRRLVRFVPLLNQFFPGWHRRFTGGRPGARADAGAGYSTTATRDLKMSLHLATGHMDGEVLRGTYRGRFLSELDRSSLLTLLGELADAESERLLTTYLDRTHAGWNTGSRADERARSGMSRNEALDVLGLAEGVGDQEILQAHRRLIQKLHPDRGGSTYLAATLNEAKRVLLGE